MKSFHMVRPLTFPPWRANCKWLVPAEHPGRTKHLAKGRAGPRSRVLHCNIGIVLSFEIMLPKRHDILKRPGVQVKRAVVGRRLTPQSIMFGIPKNTSQRWRSHFSLSHSTPKPMEGRAGGIFAQGEWILTPSSRSSHSQRAGLWETVELQVGTQPAVT